MRIANISVYDSIQQTLGKASAEMFKANEVVSTTKRINKLSDDPIGLVTVLDINSSIADIEQLGRNIDMGKTWLTSGESSLQQVFDILSSVKEVAIQMGSANTSSTERANKVILIDGYLKQIKSLANAEVGGRYIFSGTETDTIPFEFNSDETEVVYSGNDTPFSIKIGRSTSVNAGSDGQKIFGENWDDTNIFKTLVDLKTYLDGNMVSDISNTLDRLDSNMDSISNSISKIGGKSIQLSVKESIISDLKITFSERKGNLEEADITEAIMNLEAKELAYNAALSTAAKIMQVTLLDYMK